MTPRPLHPSAVAFLQAHEPTGLLDHFGGAQGAIDCAEAAHFLTWALGALAMIFQLGGQQ